MLNYITTVTIVWRHDVQTLVVTDWRATMLNIDIAEHADRIHVQTHYLHPTAITQRKPGFNLSRLLRDST